MSRGLSESQAKQLIVEGFLQSVLDEFPKELQGKAKENYETRLSTI